MKVEVTVVMRPEFSRPEYKIDEKYDGVFMNCVQILTTAFARTARRTRENTTGYTPVYERKILRCTVRATTSSVMLL